MFIIPISEHTQIHSKKVLETYNFGNRKSGHNGSPEQQFHGLCAEVELQKFFDYPLTDGTCGFDDGKDIEYKNLIIDVKTMNRSTDIIFPNWVNNLTQSQTVYSNNAYIFTSLNKLNMNLTVCGWISKSHMFKVAKLYKKGSERFKGNIKILSLADNYEIEMKDLAQVYSFQEMKDQLDMYDKFLEKRRKI